MNKTIIQILEFLLNDSELFEAIYYYLNGQVYINKNQNCLPLHKSIDSFPKWKYSPQMILSNIKEMKDKNYIEADNLDLTNFDSFSKTFIKISDKGKEIVTKTII